MSRKVRALVVPVDGLPDFAECEGLEDMQALVGGDIESVRLFDGDPICYVDADGKARQAPNRAVVRWDGDVPTGDVLDVLYGPMVFVCTREDGSDADITDDAAARVLGRFGGNAPYNPEGHGSGAAAVLGMTRGLA